MACTLVYMTSFREWWTLASNNSDITHACTTYMETACMTKQYTFRPLHADIRASVSKYLLYHKKHILGANLNEWLNEWQKICPFLGESVRWRRNVSPSCLVETPQLPSKIDCIVLICSKRVRHWISCVHISMCTKSFVHFICIQLFLPSSSSNLSCSMWLICKSSIVAIVELYISSRSWPFKVLIYFGTSHHNASI